MNEPSDKQTNRLLHARDRAGSGRDLAGQVRDDQAGQRDALSDGRDRAAFARDQAAERLQVGSGWNRGQVIELFAQSRAAAADDRRMAKRDRRGSAGDRDDAGRDRADSEADRAAGAAERTYASIDVLTGAYERGAGLAELARDVARARRMNEPLTVAYLDVDGLKAINDARSHAAGDHALMDVVTALRASLRTHDLIIRLGGDEFLCACTAMLIPETTERFVQVNAALAAAAHPSSVTVGFATLQGMESVEHLIHRADAAFYIARRSR